MTEKSNLDAALIQEIQDLEGTEESLNYVQVGEPQPPVETVTTSTHDEQAFLKDVLGPYAAEAPKSQSERPKQEKYDSDKKHAAPKIVHMTKGGKEIHVDQRDSGKFFVKFVPGGEMPKELSGEYTREDLAHESIKVYLAKQ